MLGVLCWSLFWNALLYVPFSCTIISTRKSCLAFIVFRMSCYRNVLRPFLMMRRVGLQFVFVFFPDHTPLLFSYVSNNGLIFTNSWFYRKKLVTTRGVQYVMKPIHNSIHKQVRILCYIPNERSKRRRYNGT